MKILKSLMVSGCVAGVVVMTGCMNAGVKTAPVSKELVMHSASPQALGYSRTTKSLKGKVRTAKLHSIENDLYHYKTDDGYEWTNYLNPILPSPAFSGDEWGTGTQEMSDVEGALFPLAVGNKMQFMVTGNSTKSSTGWKEERDCEVESQERVTTEGGEFDAFKVVCNSEWRKRTYYVAPELNDIVLHRNIHKTDPQKNSGWELAAAPAS
jgi:hypothetical protein